MGNVGSMTAADKMKGVVAKFVALSDAEKQVLCLYLEEVCLNFYCHSCHLDVGLQG